MISKNIRSIRQTHDLTLPEFADIIGVSRNSLIRYENGSSENREMSMNLLKKIEAHLKNFDFEDATNVLITASFDEEFIEKYVLQAAMNEDISYYFLLEHALSYKNEASIHYLAYSVLRGAFPAIITGATVVAKDHLLLAISLDENNVAYKKEFLTLFDDPDVTVDRQITLKYVDEILISLSKTSTEYRNILDFRKKLLAGD